MKNDCKNLVTRTSQKHFITGTQCSNTIQSQLCPRQWIKPSNRLTKIIQMHFCAWNCHICLHFGTKHRKNIGTLHRDKLSFPSPFLSFYIVCSPIFIWENVATDSISSVSMPLKNASWGTDKIKLRYFCLLSFWNP